MSTTDARGRIHLTPEEAIARLPDERRIHTFVDAGTALVGAHMTRDDVVELIRTHGADETGKIAQSFGHGLAVWRDEAQDDVLFIQSSGPPPAPRSPLDDSAPAVLGDGGRAEDRRAEAETPRAIANPERSSRRRSSPLGAAADPSGAP